MCVHKYILDRKVSSFSSSERGASAAFLARIVALRSTMRAYQVGACVSDRGDRGDLVVLLSFVVPYICFVGLVFHGLRLHVTGARYNNPCWYVCVGIVSERGRCACFQSYYHYYGGP